MEEHDKEGRVITLEMPDFFLVTVYTPNSQDGLKRLDYRMQWEEAFRAYLLQLNARKPVIVCGDLNVAHREIDLKNPKSNRKNAGFTDEEREKFGILLDSGFTDTFRFFYPDREGIYSWWSYRFKARGKECRVAYRLFLSVQTTGSATQKRNHTHRDFRFRPLPGGGRLVLTRQPLYIEKEPFPYAFAHSGNGSLRIWQILP